MYPYFLPFLLLVHLFIPLSLLLSLRLPQLPTALFGLPRLAQHVDGGPLSALETPSPHSRAKGLVAQESGVRLIHDPAWLAAIGAICLVLCLAIVRRSHDGQIYTCDGDQTVD